MVEPIKDLQNDWENWQTSDLHQKLWVILRGLIEIPVSFALWLRLTLHIGILNMMCDLRGEPHPDIDGSTDLCPKSPIQEPELEPEDDLYIRIISASIGLIMFSLPIFPLYPDQTHVMILLYLNFAILIFDPLFLFFDR